MDTNGFTMDLLRRIFDIPLNRNDDDRYRMNPKDDPSGRYDADNFSGCYGGGPHNGGGNYQPGGYGCYDDTFGDFHGIDQTPPPPPPQHYMPSVFGQMDEMFRHLDTMMQGMHLGPGQGAGIQGAVITEIEEETADSGRNPRDAMLKNPDSSNQRTPLAPPVAPYHHQSPGHVNPQHPQYEGGDEFANFGAFGAFGGFGKVMDPFRMMEDFFRVFEGRPAIPHLPGPDPVPVHPRDSAVKKDTDLDDSAPCGMGLLLDEGPKYEGTVQGNGKQGDGDGNNPQSSAGTQQPGAAIQPKHPEMQTRFHSTSVIRVRKPDGSIEETRKYRDHTGREEVTVQRKEVDELTPGVIQPGNDMPSMFSRNFHWW